jgi:AraC-like DNA-binding protein/mannose-6-phosphate isomerase-like protein (cupin superfamily)
MFLEPSFLLSLKDHLVLFCLQVNDIGHLLWRVGLDTQVVEKAQQMNRLLSEFEIIHYKDDNFKEAAYHYHNYYEIYFFISGDVTYHAKGVIYALNPGDIILLNNKTLHRLSRATDVLTTQYERMVIQIDPDFILNNFLAGDRLANCFDCNINEKSRLLRLKKEDREEIEAIRDKLVTASTRRDYGNDILQINYLIELLVYLNKAQIKSQNVVHHDIGHDPEINMILAYFEQNIEGDLSLDTIAAALSLEKHSMIRKFKKRMGLSPHQYIKKMRLVKARDLLKNDISVTDVCYQCGFNDYSNFIRSFTQAFGVSPKKFTRVYLDKKLQ